ncbi:MAG TPA: TerC/Alx family metal homeostasis membrane protein [Opitutaceae bacterium]|nr:TerC/Alx family metal homeostasis membrane protein [Opitutaceae bacterium]
MESTTLLWIIFWSTFVLVSAVDYFVVTHRKTTIGVKSALRWTALWVCIALSFSIAIYLLHPNGKAVVMEYISGYLTEYSLSVDNLFVFILIFSLMGVKEVAQPKLIKLGIYLSIVLRIIFIVFGIALVERFHWLLYLFGAVLVWTAWKMISSEEDDQVQPEKNLLYRAASKLFPLHNDPQENKRLFARYEGKLFITPFFLVFVVIGSTDVLFAVDSIPAIMGISQDPFVVLTSNIFAVLGLNSLFFAIRGIMGMFRFLKHGVSIILFFIGGKMIVPGLGKALMFLGAHTVGTKLEGTEHWFKIHTSASLLVIGLVLLVSIVMSIWYERDAHPNSTEKK